MIGLPVLVLRVTFEPVLEVLEVFLLGFFAMGRLPLLVPGRHRPNRPGFDRAGVSDGSAGYKFSVHYREGRPRGPIRPRLRSGQPMRPATPQPPIAHARARTAVPLGPRPSVADRIARWPVGHPLTVLTAGGRTRPEWTLLAEPAATRVETDPVRALTRLREIAAPTRSGSPRHAGDAPETPPLTSGWALALSYELGKTLEPRAGSRTTGSTDPMLVATRIEAVAAHRASTGTWCTAGSPPPELQPEPPPSHHDRADASTAPTDLRPVSGTGSYERRVREALEYIRAGDIYQVNLTERFEALGPPPHRLVAAEVFDRAPPAHGLLLEWPGISGATDALVSASPELFLEFEPSTRTLRTRPMKGTRPAHADAEELRTAEKDRAELAMIVDLMRNDLARVCDLPTVRVEEARAIDEHGASVLQATATVAGRLREPLTLADAIEATFPPGSVTGAPKIRAMQLIDELEPTPRGLYCGIAGWIGDNGRAELSVTIRAATFTGPPSDRRAHVPAGAGIVADSDSDAEWAETVLKTQRMRSALNEARS
jgi:para-aminobenzoate synthetase component 1